MTSTPICITYRQMLLLAIHRSNFVFVVLALAALCGQVHSSTVTVDEFIVLGTDATGIVPGNEVVTPALTNTGAFATILIFLYYHTTASTSTSSNIGFYISTSGLGQAAGDNITSFAIYKGGSTDAIPTTGPVIPLADNVNNPDIISNLVTMGFASGEYAFTDDPTRTIIEDIATSPTDYFVDIQTATHPSGAGRAQLQTDTLYSQFSVVSADLEARFVQDSAVTTDTAYTEPDSNGLTYGGSAYLVVYEYGGLAYCGLVVVVTTIPSLSSGAVYAGKTGIEGSQALLDFTSGLDASFRFDDVIFTSFDLATVQGILAAPTDYYFQLATAMYPNGAYRGQLADTGYVTINASAPPSKSNAYGLQVTWANWARAAVFVLGAMLFC